MRRPPTALASGDPFSEWERVNELPVSTPPPAPRPRTPTPVLEMQARPAEGATATQPPIEPYHLALLGGGGLLLGMMAWVLLWWAIGPSTLRPMLSSTPRASPPQVQAPPPPAPQALTPRFEPPPPPSPMLSPPSVVPVEEPLERAPVKGPRPAPRKPLSVPRPRR